MKVAHMPWDPVPVAPGAGNASAGPSNASAASQLQQQQTMPNHGGSLAASKAEASLKAEPAIKQEPKYENVGGDLGRFPPAYGANAGLNPQAADRASALLQQRFGAQAHASIQAAGLPPQPRQLALPGQQRPQQGGAARSLGNSQLDGEIDWDAIVLGSRDEDGKRPALDRILESTAQKDEPVTSDQPQTVTFMPLSQSKKAVIKIPRVDGGGDTDEDAINSDLDDDDEDDAQNIADDGQQGEMILCLWDKVNRVKSKVRGRQDPMNASSSTKLTLIFAHQWKCTLKDGILSTGGKEYLFQKATGEFEW
jgi:transcription initiation factor TFIIA large subunit